MIILVNFVCFHAVNRFSRIARNRVDTTLCR